MQLSNKFIDYSICIQDDITYVKFTVDKMSLSPGVYNVRFYMDDSVNILDWIDNAFSFTVEKGDFYGCGMVEDSAMFNTDFTLERL